MKKTVEAWCVLKNGTINGMVEYPNCQMPVFPDKGTAMKFAANNQYPVFYGGTTEWRYPEAVVKCSITYEKPSEIL